MTSKAKSFELDLNQNATLNFQNERLNRIAPRSQGNHQRTRFTGLKILDISADIRRLTKHNYYKKIVALVFDIQLKETFEAYPNSPSKDRLASCFQIFEDLIPHTGALSPVLQNLKEELFRSVYSKGLTSSKRNPYVERIPYFSVVEGIELAR